MKRQTEFLEKLIRLIEAAGIPYAVCGSLSSSLYGQPRATNDADIIIAPTRDQLDKLLKSLETGYYISNEAALEAMKNHLMFNVIDNKLGWKADLIFREDIPYQLTKFNRRIRAKLMGIDLWILSPEDVILSKLDWAKDSGSDMQLRDVFGVIKLQWDKLDWNYLRHWAKELDVEKNLEKVKEEVMKVRGEQ
jgi:predicted nucleotidyltransferase